MQYATVSLRKDLVERVRKVVNSGIGYRSIADFVAEATRCRLEEVEPLLEKLPKAPAKLPAGVYAEPGGPTRGHEPQPLEEAVEGVGTGG
jgi:Arc/MetJ-type ribon-helix-helix transcriptional regulator